MRRYGKNRASADWFLNMRSKRRVHGRVLTDIMASRASTPLWDGFRLRVDEFHPAQKWLNAPIRRR